AQGAQSWLGVDASGLGVALVGIPSVTLSVTNGGLKVNRAVGASKLDWASFAPAGLALPHLDIAAGTDLHASGTVALSFAGAVVAVGTLSLDTGQVTDAATVGTDAQTLALRLTDAALFAGTGGVLTGTTIDTTGATGVYGEVGSLTVVSITQGPKSWL